MDAKEYVYGLRELADWIEENEEFVESKHLLQDSLGSLLMCALTEEELAQQVQVLGRGQKSGDDRYFKVTRQFGPVQVYAFIQREKVCRKVTRTELREVEVTEWECEDSILDHLPEAVAS